MIPGALQRIRELRPFWREDSARADLELGHLQAELVADAAYHGVPTWRASGAAEVAAPGLVSVPTTCTARRRQSSPFRVAAQSAAAREALGAFVPDPGAGRLARLRRGIGVAARCLDAATVEPVRVVMLTLTYRGTNADWQPNHIRRFLSCVREHLRRLGQSFRYVWVAELQKRGVIHYHVATWLPLGVELPKPDAAGWWPHGMTRIETARKAVPYLMKYLSKDNTLTGATLPHGARCHGRGGLGEAWRAVVRWLSLPAFIQARASVADRWRRAAGGGWVDPDGELWPSEFVREFVGDGWALRRVVNHGRPFEAAGPFSWVKAWAS